MNCYLDSSSILRFLTKANGHWEKFGKWKKSGTSRITEIECHRTLDRMRLMNEYSDEELTNAKIDLKNILYASDSLRISESVIERAKNPYSIIIRTLDAMHIATALEWQREIQEPVTMVSHDKRMNQLALYVGLEIVEGI